MLKATFSTTMSAQIRMHSESITLKPNKHTSWLIRHTSHPYNILLFINPLTLFFNILTIVHKDLFLLPEAKPNGLVFNIQSTLFYEHFFTFTESK